MTSQRVDFHTGTPDTQKAELLALFLMTFRISSLISSNMKYSQEDDRHPKIITYSVCIY